MILELVEFNSPKGWSRQQVAEEARHVIPKWQANKELLRKHFLLELASMSGRRSPPRSAPTTRNGGKR
jgi:hypothetical protein